MGKERVQTVEPVKGIRKGLGDFLRNLRVERKYTNDSVAASREVAEVCAKRLCKGQTAKEQVTTAIVLFIDNLRRAKEVQAVAFASSDAANSPTTLVIEVVTKIQRESNTSTATVRDVTAAKAALAAKVAPFFPIGFQFFDSTGTPSDTLELRLETRWREEPRLELIAWEIFERD